MRAAIVVHSKHHGNTRQVAEAIAGELCAQLVTLDQVGTIDSGSLELIGLGSGIYFGAHAAALRAWVKSATAVPRHSFVFSTAGISLLSRLWHAGLVRQLHKRGSTVLGEFCCPGWDSVGPLKLLGGIHRGRPNENDLRNAVQFAREVRARWERCR